MLGPTAPPGRVRRSFSKEPRSERNGERQNDARPARPRRRVSWLSRRNSASAIRLTLPSSQTSPASYAAADRPRHTTFASPNRARSGSKCRTSSPFRCAMGITIPCITPGMSEHGGPAMASLIPCRSPTGSGQRRGTNLAKPCRLSRMASHGPSYRPARQPRSHPGEAGPWNAPDKRGGVMRQTDGSKKPAQTDLIERCRIRGGPAGPRLTVVRPSGQQKSPPTIPRMTRARLVADG